MRSLLTIAMAIALAACSQPAPSAPTTPGEPAPAVSAVPSEPRCAPPPGDLPAIQIEEDGQFRRLKKFPLGEFSARTVTVYLPKTYDGARRFPVLYAPDGQAIFALASMNQAMEKIAGTGAIEPHIIVAVDAEIEQRVAELVPEDRGDAFADAIATRVKPYIDQQFATRCDRASTAITGFSLGGLLCINLLIRHSKIFGRGACSSPSAWWNDRSFLARLDAHEGEMPLRLWIDVGSEERPKPAEALDPKPQHDHIDAIRAVRDLALSRGMVLGRDLGYYEVRGSTHDPAGWRERLAVSMAFALSDRRLDTEVPDDVELIVWDATIARQATEALRPATRVSFEARYAPPLVLTWPSPIATITSRDPSVATVEAGRVIPKRAGTASLEGSLRGGKTVTAVVTVQ